MGECYAGAVSDEPEEQWGTTIGHGGKTTRHIHLLGAMPHTKNTDHDLRESNDARMEPAHTLTK